MKYEKKCNQFTQTECRELVDTVIKETCTMEYNQECEEEKAGQRCAEQCESYGYYQQCQRVAI